MDQAKSSLVVSARWLRAYLRICLNLHNAASTAVETIVAIILTDNDLSNPFFQDIAARAGWSITRGHNPDVVVVYTRQGCSLCMVSHGSPGFYWSDQFNCVVSIYFQFEPHYRLGLRVWTGQCSSTKAVSYFELTQLEFGLLLPRLMQQCPTIDKVWCALRGNSNQEISEEVVPLNPIVI
jgi:hypothetical protein